MGKCSVGLFRGNELVGYRAEERHNQQAERLLPLIEDVLGSHYNRYQDLDYIALSVGPGSFTGIRVGIAVANALSMVIRKPVIGVSCFESVVRDNGTIYVLLDGGGNNIYVQGFHDRVPTGAPRMFEPGELEQLMEEGKLVGNVHVEEPIVPNAELVGISAINKLIVGGMDWVKPVPLYVKAPYL